MTTKWTARRYRRYVTGYPHDRYAVYGVDEQDEVGRSKCLYINPMTLKEALRQKGGHPLTDPHTIYELVPLTAAELRRKWKGAA